MKNSPQPNKPLEKKLNILAAVITVVVLALTGMMNNPKFKIHTTIDLSFLPPFHSTLNALAGVALIFALYFIKNKNRKAHQNMIYTAMILSGMFLVSYVLYHFTNESVKYGDANFDGVVDATELAAVGSTRTIYLILLVTHVILAGLTLPFILLTFNRAYTNQFDRHKKMARWVYPFWLYVTISGPICYLMLRPFYP